MSTCVTPACLYRTETLALTELQQQRLQVCENNWVRKTARVTRADRRRMVELREETGVQRSLTERLVRSRLHWAGHVERMADDRLPKRAAELREQGRRRRGRPRLRWEDCVRRDVKKAGEEGDWKKKTQDRVGWKRLADEAVKKLQASPHPWQREKEEERERVVASYPNLIKQNVLPLEEIMQIATKIGGHMVKRDLKNTEVSCG